MPGGTFNQDAQMMNELRYIHGRFVDKENKEYQKSLR